MSEHVGIAEVVVDDSADDTRWLIQQVAAGSTLPVSLLRPRPRERTGGLSGAVADGILAAFTDRWFRDTVAATTPSKPATPISSRPQRSYRRSREVLAQSGRISRNLLLDQVSSRRLMVLAATVLLIAASIMVIHMSRFQHPVVYGLSVPDNDPATIASLTQQTGYRPQVLNVFVKLDSPSFGPATLSQISEMGAKPMITLEPWSWRSSRGQPDQASYSLAALASGHWDRSFTNIAKTILGYQGLVYLRFAHEMNGWWYPWAESVNSNRSGDYVRAWRHVHDIFRNVGCTNVRWIWSPNALTTSSKGTSDLATLYPGDNYVDMLGMTAYGHGASAAQTFDTTLQALHAVTHNKNIIISETGADGPDKTEWITSFGQYLDSHSEIHGFVWFNTTPSSTGASGDYRFDDTPENLNAFRNVLRRANVTTQASALR